MMPKVQNKTRRGVDPLAIADVVEDDALRFHDIEERRLKEWENYQRIHRSYEDQKANRAFLDISIDDVLTGRLVLKLLDSVVPTTVQHFRSLVTGSVGNGSGGMASDYLFCSLRCIDRLNNQITFGEIGLAGGEPLHDENFALRHTERGLLTMTSCGPHTSNYSFGITLGAAPSLDYRQVVFGKVIDGISLLEKLESLPTNAVGRPLNPVVISFCGALTGSRPPGGRAN